MGFSDLREKVVSSASGLFKREEDDGAQDGLRGSSKGIGFTKGGGSSNTGGRAWTQLDSSNGKSGDTGVVQLAVRGAQVFCLLVSIFINAHMTSIQKKWDVGPSGLVVFSFFLLIIAVLSSITMLALPLVHERNGKLRDLSRGLRGLRPSFLINGSQTVLLAILALVLTISSNTKGCKNPEADENAEKEGYLEVLPDFCRDKRALTAFVWLAFLGWLVSLVFVLRSWRKSRSSPPIPAFNPPVEDEWKEGSEAGDENHVTPYDAIPAPSSMPYSGSANAPASPYGVGGFQAQAAARQSGTFYEGGRAFDDQTPTGYGSSPYSDPYAGQASPAYEDPYDRIRRERGL